MATNLVQLPGENITVPVEADVVSGDLVLVGQLYGVAQSDAKDITNTQFAGIFPGASYYTTIATEGVYKIPGITGIAVGGEVTATIGSSTAVIGCAIRPSDAEGTEVRLQQGGTVA